MNGSVVTNGALHKKNRSDKIPRVRKEEIVSRFIGGWGEKCFMKGLHGETGNDTEDNEDSDKRGLVSAGWGSRHDGSVIECDNVYVQGVSPKVTPSNRKEEIPE